MPGTSTTGSTNISVLDSKIVADLCSGYFYVDVTPSIYIGSGAENVIGANVQIRKDGLVIKPYGPDYEIAPALSGGMDAVISFAIPTIAGNYQYGTYYIDVQLFDGVNSWVVTKPVTICEPDKKNKQRKYGSLSALLKASCKDGKLYVIVDGVPNYKGKTVESVVQEFTLEYPTSSEVDPLVTSLSQFSVTLYEGVYKINGEICATYNFGDNVYVKVKYKVKKEKNVRCLVDECCVFAKLEELHKKLGTDCTDEEKTETTSIAMDALRLLKTAQLAADCGEDASEYIEDLEALLGCKCTCNCAEGTPIINSTPVGDFDLTGCNTTKTVVGLTTTFNIDNYEYIVEVAPNGGLLVVSAPTLNSCTKTQVLTFNIGAVYNAIKALADQNSTEQLAWAAIINKSLDAIVTECSLATGWATMTFAQRITAIWNRVCECCGCDASILSAGGTNSSGNDVQLVWEWGTPGFAAEIYLDGVLKGKVLHPANEFTFVGAADGGVHDYQVVPVCENGSIGTSLEDEFIHLACPDIAPPVVPVKLIEDATCPYDLTSLTDPAPLGITYEWHDADDTTPDSLVPDPTNVSTGIFYVFAKDADGCYSIGIKVTLICEAATSCTAPQNLFVDKLLSCPAFVRFQSAAYPPPGNSYTVKRRLKADPDIPASYTTIGTPVWSAPFNRWVICDFSGFGFLDDTAYTYVAQSNCGDSPMTTPSVSYDFANFSCPALVLLGLTDSVDYELVPPGGDIDKIEVSIYDEDGAVLIHTDTHLPAFSNPLGGIFTYLEPNTTYKVKAKFFIGTMESDCQFYTVTTAA